MSKTKKINQTISELQSTKGLNLTEEEAGQICETVATITKNAGETVGADDVLVVSKARLAKYIIHTCDQIDLLERKLSIISIACDI